MKKRQTLAEKFPELAKQWHPTKNGDLKPTDVSCGYGKKIWWLFPYDDPETGKHFDFEWEASVCNRTKGRGCPYLCGRAVWPGFNDLATKDPELAKQWHPTKNGSLKPTSVRLGSHRKVWWLYPYDDPKTGKHFDFEWQASIASRVKAPGCPFLSSQAVWPGYNDLATKMPCLAKQWHPTKNGSLKPTSVHPGSQRKVWWLYPYDDPKTGKHFDFEWQASIANRVKTPGCPFLSGRAVWPGYNDLATKMPCLAKQWHPTKNGGLGPMDVTCGVATKVWWYLPYDDPVTGLHYDFEWKASVKNRVVGDDCPFLSGQAVWPGFNDLATRNPVLAREWHPTKNGQLKPIDVTYGTHAKVWWYLPYDDPETGLHYDFEWEASVKSRVVGSGCPFLCGQAVWPGYNDLATKAPKLAREWHPTKNEKLHPTNITFHSRKKVWWYLPYDDPETGIHFDFEWEAMVDVRAKGQECPYLSGKAVWRGYNDLATKAPDLAKEWHPTKNNMLKPEEVTCGSDKKVWWYLPYDDPETGAHFDFEWKEKINNRIHGRACPYLSGRAVMQGFNDLFSNHPEMSMEWHPTKNRKRTPDQVYEKDSRKYWWLCPACGKAWRSSVYERVCNGRNCDGCKKRKTKEEFF